MPFGRAEKLIFWLGGIDTLTVLKYRGVLSREASLVPATTVRVIAGAAGGVCAGAATASPATTNSPMAMAKRCRAAASELAARGGASGVGDPSESWTSRTLCWG